MKQPLRLDNLVYCVWEVRLYLRESSNYEFKVSGDKDKVIQKGGGKAK